MSKHTPGPWTAALWTDNAVGAVAWSISAGTPNRRVPTSTFETDDEEEAEANARLISAAPDLLEAAKLVLAWYEVEDDHSKADFYERVEMCRQSEVAIRAAIAKATGSAT